RLADTDVTKSGINYLHYIHFHRDLLTAISGYAKGEVLDIGCGNKPYEKNFTHATNYVGCDIIQSDLKKVDVMCAANAIPLARGTFDTIFSTQTIEHVEDHQGLVNEAFRLVKPGGYFIVAGPFNWPLHEEPYDFFRFTKHGFAYIIEKAGFKMVEIKSNGGTWATTGQNIMHAFANSKSQHFFIRFSRFLFYRLRIQRLVNSFFAWLDKADYNEAMTINYVVVAQKPFNSENNIA
ncbi:MAG: class I SAM-dependent methyltransferase, partial [Bacteroidota bacterium]|nr:class I SAM-dependent methyltransferase [Bacteroidota bacterium]